MEIAYRRLVVSAPGGDIDVPIRLFQPEDDNGMWVCRYEIGWPDRKRSYFGAGVDAVQALVHALLAIGAEIYASDYHKSGALRWYEPDRGYGFLLGNSLRDLLVGDDAKYF